MATDPTPQPVEVDELEYRNAIAHFATGVTVVTTAGADGAPRGMTASAVASVSLRPVLLLVCIDNRLPTHEALTGSRRFAINVLGADDAELARRFADPHVDKFEGVALREHCSLPVLSRAIAYFVCDLHERLPGGDHSIFIGRVRECAYEPGRRPLLYYRSGFGRLEEERPPIHLIGHPLA
jgi:flavin reductase (DIM6/NTAB) family NADH-FMN oxidoreductase RutF